MAVETTLAENRDSADAHRQMGTRPITRPELAFIASIVALFLIQAFIVLRQGAPFGHDESVYALRARDFVRGDDPLFYWQPFRAPGLPLTLIPLWLIKPTEPFLRAVVTGFGATLLIASWWLGRTMFDRRTGLIAAAGLSLTPLIIASSTQLWPDIPGAALSTVTLAFYAWALTRPRLTAWIVVVVPVLVGVATLVRYGAPLSLAPGLIALTLWQHRVVSRNWKIVALTALCSGFVVGAILLIPQATAWAQTSWGDAVSPLDARFGRGSQWSEGFRGYWDRRVDVIDGIPRLTLILGLVAGVVASVQRKISHGAFLTSISAGIATFLIIAGTIHAEMRYLSPVFPWFWLGAAAGIAYLTRSWTRWVTASVVLLIVAIWVPSSFHATERASQGNIASHSSIKSASRAIDAASPDYACSAISSYIPQVDWYSRCRTRPFNQQSVVTDHPLLPDGDSFLVIVDRGKRQPADVVLQGYIDETDGIFTTTGDPSTRRPRYVEVYRTIPDD